MLDPYKLQEETDAAMCKYFRVYDLANFMEATESEMKELPAAFMMPFTEDPRGETFNSMTDQAGDQVIGVTIISTAEKLREARKHAHSVFVGHTPHPDEINIPFHPMLWHGGEIKTIKGPNIVWMDLYRTYTLGGC